MNLLNGFNNQSSAYLWDYGAAFPCGNYTPGSLCGSGTSSYYWDYGEFYNAAWGIGHDMALPESYVLPYWAQYDWNPIYYNTVNGCADCDGSRMYFSGVMNDDGWNDPANQYGKFFAYVPAPSAFYFDTCMPYNHDDSNTPCY